MLGFRSTRLTANPSALPAQETRAPAHPLRADSAPRAADPHAGLPPSSPRAWAPLAAFRAKAAQVVTAVARQLPAVAAVTLALSFGSGLAHGAPVTALSQPAAVVQTVSAPAAQPAEVQPTYTVKRGDNLSIIAKRLGTDPTVLQRLNDIRYANLIYPGQVLKLPASVSATVAADAEARPGAATRSDMATPHDIPATYTVQRGDNVGRISQRVGVAADQIIDLNHLRAPYVIHPGQILRLTDQDPAVVAPAEDPVVVAPPVAPVDAPVVDALPGDGVGIAHLSAADQAVFTQTRPGVHWGMSGHTVELVQDQLTRLGYPLGAADGSFGAKTRSAVRAFQAFNGIEPDGVVGRSTWDAMASMDAVRLPTDGTYPAQRVYRQFTADAYRLFLRAASDEGLPADWAIADSLHKLIDAESDGEVGRPNYTYGWRANRTSEWPAIHAELQRGRISAVSSATGIGQLLLSNVERHYPSGRDGINVPLEEARGMLSYIQERHRTPDQAWRNYNSVHEGY
jgi:LysM repeat protein